jgi:hypothetical protein
MKLADRLRFYFLDDIAANPMPVVSDLLSFLDADPGKASQERASRNRKARADKPVMSAEVRAGLIDYFADEIRACATVFGGAAARWPARYGL